MLCLLQTVAVLLALVGCRVGTKAASGLFLPAPMKYGAKMEVGKCWPAAAGLMDLRLDVAASLQLLKSAPVMI